MIISSIDFLGRIRTLSSLEEANRLLDEHPGEFRIVLQESHNKTIKDYIRNTQNETFFKKL